MNSAMIRLHGTLVLAIHSYLSYPLPDRLPDNVLRVPTWPNHTSVPATYLAGFISTALATDTLQGHLSLERTK